jgi:hypothetical protein
MARRHTEDLAPSSPMTVGEVLSLIELESIKSGDTSTSTSTKKSKAKDDLALPPLMAKRSSDKDTTLLQNPTPVPVPTKRKEALKDAFLVEKMQKVVKAPKSSQLK